MVDTQTSMDLRDRRYDRTITARNCVKKELHCPKVFPLSLLS